MKNDIHTKTLFNLANWKMTIYSFVSFSIQSNIRNGINENINIISFCTFCNFSVYLQAMGIIPSVTLLRNKLSIHFHYQISPSQSYQLKIQRFEGLKSHLWDGN